jgi:hypothetical protein
MMRVNKEAMSIWRSVMSIFDCILKGRKSNQAGITMTL